MFDVLHIPLAFTWEIYGDLQADNDDCFRMFNPVSKAVFQVRKRAPLSFLSVR